MSELFGSGGTVRPDRTTEIKKVRIGAEKKGR